MISATAHEYCCERWQKLYYHFLDYDSQDLSLLSLLNRFMSQ